MIRRRLAVLAAGAALAGPVTADEGGVIRSGEHASFSRIVMIVEPTTEWSLELGARRATISFPGKAIPFSTAGVFERMPRTRIMSVETREAPEGSMVTVSLGCNCRVSTAFVGARYLALDVHEPHSEPAPPVAPDEVPPSPAAAADVEAVLDSAERILVGQIQRAADQGLVELTEMPDAGPDEEAEAAPNAGRPTAPAVGSEASDDERLIAHLATTLAQADEQVRATTVFDRDNAAAREERDTADAAPVCQDDTTLDVTHWSDGRPFTAQAVERQLRLVGEFDRPDAQAVGDLARLYIRHGLGAEAGAILRGFQAEVENRALLADLARVVEGRAPAPDGALALGVACPGRHGLWLAVADNPAQLAAEPAFASIQAAFEDMPPDLRVLIGPVLVANYLDAGRPEAARVLYDVMARAGSAPDAGMELAAGRLAAHENRPLEAERRLAALVESNAPNAADALIALVRARLDFGDGVPPRWITDLGALAIERRGGPREAAARILAAEARARNGDLTGAFAGLASLIVDRPSTRSKIAVLAAGLLAKAEPEAVGLTAFAEAALGFGPMIPTAQEHDAARIAIAGKLIDLGLAQPALAMLTPPLRREVTPAQIMAARAHVGLGDPELALGLLEGLAGTEAAALRARALARRGEFAAAAETLADGGLDAETLPYAWVAGDWARAATSEEPVQATMAHYMRDREAATPETMPAPLTPEAAFRLLPPRSATPSLAVSRAAIETGAAVEEFVEALLAGQ